MCHELSEFYELHESKLGILIRVIRQIRLIRRSLNSCIRKKRRI
jgi:hypothetical protein